MFKAFPKIGEPLSLEHIDFLNVLSKSCRSAIVQMVTNAKSGHPGGSCSVIDYLSLIYAFIVSQTGENVVVSNGHVSPAVYAVLAEMGYIPRQEVIDTFRKAGSIFEGHVARLVPGVHYSTGPLGAGVSAAAGFAMAEKLSGKNHRVFALSGDGESEEGQVYESMHFVNKYKLANTTMFVDYNEVQLTDSLAKVMPMDLSAIYKSAHWNVLEVDGHDFQAMWDAVGKSYKSDLPTVLLAHTIMGKGVKFMEPDGLAHKATWHGVAPKPEQAAEAVANELAVSTAEKAMLDEFRGRVVWSPAEDHGMSPLPLTHLPEVKTGTPKTLPAGTSADCRTAYGKALKELADLNPNVVALTADLKESVKTNYLEEAHPERHLDCGIAEQHMVSCAGGMSLSGFIPFASTFGAFMSSRAKDQARVNDINRTNVKMVATHCGLSVGEDGPTHQTIDDMGSFLGFFNTHILEPADANQCDRIIRFVASHYGNFYVRMGRHKYNVILKTDGTPFYDEKYQFEYGKADVLREGTDVTVVACGSMLATAVDVADALNAKDKIKDKDKVSVEVIGVSSLKRIDLDTVLTSLGKTGKLITLEDHNALSGLASQINGVVAQEGLNVLINNMAVREYQLSGTAQELYAVAGLGPKDLEKAILAMI